MTKSGPPTRLAPSEYEAIERAMMETARGRWFLAQFAENNRREDTTVVLEAIDKLRGSMVTARTGPEVDRIKRDLVEMCTAIARMRVEIYQLKFPEDEENEVLETAEELEAIIDTAEQTTRQILQSAEGIQEMAWTIREDIRDDGGVDAPCARIDQEVTEIYHACAHQEVAGQRTQKLVRVLRYLEARINAMVSIWGLEEELLKKQEQDRQEQTQGQVAENALTSNVNSDVPLLDSPENHILESSLEAGNVESDASLLDISQNQPAALPEENRSPEMDLLELEQAQPSTEDIANELASLDSSINTQEENTSENQIAAENITEVHSLETASIEVPVTQEELPAETDTETALDNPTLESPETSVNTPQLEATESEIQKLPENTPVQSESETFKADLELEQSALQLQKTAHEVETQSTQAVETAQELSQSVETDQTAELHSEPPELPTESAQLDVALEIASALETENDETSADLSSETKLDQEPSSPDAALENISTIQETASPEEAAINTERSELSVDQTNLPELDADITEQTATVDEIEALATLADELTQLNPEQNAEQTISSDLSSLKDNNNDIVAIDDSSENITQDKTIPETTQLETASVDPLSKPDDTSMPISDTLDKVEVQSAEDLDATETPLELDTPVDNVIAVVDVNETSGEPLEDTLDEGSENTVTPPAAIESKTGEALTEETQTDLNQPATTKQDEPSNTIRPIDHYLPNPVAQEDVAEPDLIALHSPVDDDEENSEELKEAITRDQAQFVKQFERISRELEKQAKLSPGQDETPPAAGEGASMEAPDATTKALEETPTANDLSVIETTEQPSDIQKQPDAATPSLDDLQTIQDDLDQLGVEALNTPEVEKPPQTEILEEETLSATKKVDAPELSEASLAPETPTPEKQIPEQTTETPAPEVPTKEQEQNSNSYSASDWVGQNLESFDQESEEEPHSTASSIRNLSTTKKTAMFD